MLSSKMENPFNEQVQNLNKQFGLEGQIEFGLGKNGLVTCQLFYSSGSSLELYLNGAHITSWKSPKGEELLFMSSESLFELGKPIRGGIPLVFPQFGPGNLPQHGFARTSEWAVSDTHEGIDHSINVVFKLSSSAATKQFWPDANFEVSLKIRLAESLECGFEVFNKSLSAIEFQQAFHTYFDLTDIANARVHGLNGVDYIDKNRGANQFHETSTELKIEKPTDAVYCNVANSVSLRDQGNHRQIDIIRDNCPDVVVWNPGSEKAKAMADFGDDEYPNMICVEAGAIVQPVVLEPHSKWNCNMQLVVNAD